MSGLRAKHLETIRSAIECETRHDGPPLELGETLSPGCPACDAIEALDAVEQILQAHENALRNWTECYPEDVFIPPTKAQVKAATDLLGANGFSPDALYAEWGRHIVRCLTEAMSA